MGKMLRHKGMLSLMAGAVFLALTCPASASTLLDLDDISSFSSTTGETGWSSAVVSSSSIKGDYLEFPAEQAFSRDAGTIEMRIVRRNVRPIETLFTLVDSVGDPLLIAQVFWEGTFVKGSPEINFEGSMSDRLWLSDWSSPRFGRSRVVASTVPLGEQIEPGGVLHIAMTWGMDPNDCAFHLNGHSLPVIVPQPFSMGEIIAGSSRLVVGAEPVPGTEGGHEHLNSPLAILRTYDVPVNPFAPIINSLSHNGAQVAGYSGKLVAGDVVTVTMTGDAYQTATFDLGRHKSVPMVEVPGRPGTYTGELAVDWLDGVIEEAVTGHLTSPDGLNAIPVLSQRPLLIDARIFANVSSDEEILPADESSTTDITVVATDANGNPVRDRELKLTLSTTDEYTGMEGSGAFSDLVGSELDIDWGGVTDSFGEVTAQYLSGFAAKTVLVSAKDMSSGDVGIGFVRSYIEGSVDIVVTEPGVTALTAAGSMDISLSREWLTADGRSRSRITAVVKDARKNPVSGHNISFTLMGKNGSIRTIQGKTDSRGRAYADYIAGTVMGQVLVEVRDLASGMVGLVSIELRPDAPAEIVLSVGQREVMAGDRTVVAARVSDANGNPNANVDVLYAVSGGDGEVSSASVATDKDGVASVVFQAAESTGIVTVRGTVTSRAPTREEIDAAQGAVFLYGLEEDPGRLKVASWLVEPGEKVVKGQELVMLENRTGDVFTVVSPREGVMSVFTAEERDRVKYGDTLGYVLEKLE